MLEGSEMFTVLWLAPPACPTVEDITAARNPNHSSLTINQPAPPPPTHPPLSASAVPVLKSALQGHF